MEVKTADFEVEICTSPDEIMVEESSFNAIAFAQLRDLEAEVL